MAFGTHHQKRNCFLVMLLASNWARHEHNMIRYDTIEEFNVDSGDAEYTA